MPSLYIPSARETRRFWIPAYAGMTTGARLCGFPRAGLPPRRRGNDDGRRGSVDSRARACPRVGVGMTTGGAALWIPARGPAPA